VKQADLAPVRFAFTSRLVRAAGYAGWVVLLDEVELVGRYSLLQRGKAYAELARWLGAVPAQAVPGMTAVAAITDDFDIHVLEGRSDREKVPARLAQRGDQASLALVAMAEAGIRLIGREAVTLHAPNDDTLTVSHDRLQTLYDRAYGFTPTATGGLDGAHRAMRSYVRRWISEWDLERLYPGAHQEALEEAVRVDLSEDPELGQESEERADEGS
jgi:hypothetical protein